MRYSNLKIDMQHLGPTSRAPCECVLGGGGGTGGGGMGRGVSWRGEWGVAPGDGPVNWPSLWDPGGRQGAGCNEEVSDAAVTTTV